MSPKDRGPWANNDGEQRGKGARFRGLAIALGSIAVLAVALGGGSLLLAQQVEGPLVLDGALPNSMSKVLDKVPSGQAGSAGEAKLRLIATFANRRAQHCRTFELEAEETSVAVACRQDAKWTLVFLELKQDGYEAKLADYMESIGATIPFAPIGEATVLRF